MGKKRVLFISQEITPYVKENELSGISRHLPQGVQEKGMEVRTFMPKYGVVNERRCQLHEVIRLSGMNIVIDGNDHPLVVKVASIQPARIQVYFVDNEDYFQRKAIFADAKGVEFSDNDERAMFFARGVIETVKKLGWAPDVIHCHGWMTSFIPLYLKTMYKDEPVFENTKIVYSLYDNMYETALDSRIPEKLEMSGISEADAANFSDTSFKGLTGAAMKWSDGVAQMSPEIPKDVSEMFKDYDKPSLEYHDQEAYVEACVNFYESITSSEEVLVD